MAFPNPPGKHTLADFIVKVTVTDEEWNRMTDDQLTDVCDYLEDCLKASADFVKDKHGVTVNVEVR
jgi:hypothetical protein